MIIDNHQTYIRFKKYNLSLIVSYITEKESDVETDGQCLRINKKRRGNSILGNCRYFIFLYIHIFQYSLHLFR